MLLAGLALRVAAMVGYQPAYLVFSDTHAYVLDAADLGEAFATDAPFRPYGYAIFLAGVASVSQTVTAVVVVQHLLGPAAALLYATVLRLGGPRWAAVASAAVVAFVPDFVLFEHALLTEAPFLLLVTAAGYATARGVQESALERRPRTWIAWLAAAGALVALAATFRAVGQVLVPAFVVIAAIAVRGDMAGRLGRLGVAPLRCQPARPSCSATEP